MIRSTNWLIGTYLLTCAKFQAFPSFYSYSKTFRLLGAKNHDHF